MPIPNGVSETQPSEGLRRYLSVPADIKQPRAIRFRRFAHPQQLSLRGLESLIPGVSETMDRKQGESSDDHEPGGGAPLWN